MGTAVQMAKFSFTNTKMVCTIGPSSSSANVQEKMIQGGMDIARLNFSHGSHSDHAKMLKQLRTVADRMEKPLAMLQDLQGPKIRTGSINPPIELKSGSTVILTGRKSHTGANRIYISYSKLAQEVKPGNCILIDDGLIELRVEKTKGDDVVCMVVVGGLLKSYKGVNLPHVPLSVPALTSKDKTDLLFGIKNGFDFIALSFVRQAKDVIRLHNSMKKEGYTIPIIAKIEKPEALDDLDNIIDAVYGIMVARGDLGVEIPAYKVPLIQKDIIRRCNIAGKPVITATQMLESMTVNPRPTRAEANDVANAVIDGTDAVMLSGETASGAYPVKAVQTMRRIIGFAEQNTQLSFKNFCIGSRNNCVADSICESSVDIANRLQARYIIPFSFSGFTARLISKYRPSQPIIAFVHDAHIARELQLSWGVETIFVPHIKDTDEMFTIVNNILKKRRLVRKGDKVIVTAGLPFGTGVKTNMVKVVTIA